jgi:hypothetical protein
MLNAVCYVVAGVAALVMAAQPNVPGFWAVLLGLAGIAYGAKILLTRSSYWISSAVYAVAFIAVAAAIGMMVN